MARTIQAAAATVAAVILGLAALIPQQQPVELSAAPAVAEHKSYFENIPGSDPEVKFEMIAIPGGTFTMGSPDSEKGRNADEGPQHEVKVGPFWMARCEVTWDEFDLYWKTDPAVDPNKPEAAKPGVDAVSRPTPPYVDETYGHDRDGHPAICMTHHAAMRYCEWLSVKTGKAYRLPTEAEWECACRAGSKGPYCFGDDASKLGEYAWYAKNSPDETRTKGTTHKVGTKKPNAFGLCDMHGNVMEWCIDHYGKDTYSKFAENKLSLNPVIVPTARKWSHVCRGGSWLDDPAALRCAARRASHKDWMKHDPQLPQSIWWLTKFDIVGFRVVRAVDELPELKGIKSKVTIDSE